MVKEMQAYSHRKTPMGYDFTGFDDDNNHSLDALRYALDSFVDSREVRLGATQPRDKQKHMQYLYERAYYHNDREAQKELLEAQIQKDYIDNFGASFDLKDVKVPSYESLTPKSDSAKKIEEEVQAVKRRSKSFTFKF